MGTIRSRRWKGERVWFIDYIAADGRRIRQTIGPGDQNRRLARQILVQREAEATLGQHHIPISQTVRFGEFTEDWLQRIASRVKPKTLELYEDTVQQHLVPWFGGMHLGAITRRDVEAYLANKVATGTRRGREGKAVPLAPRTVNHSLIVLKSIIKDAIEQGMLTESSSLRTKPIRDPRRDDGEKVRAMQPVELEALLAVAWDPLAHVVASDGACGAPPRRGTGRAVGGPRFPEGAAPRPAQHRAHSAVEWQGL